MIMGSTVDAKNVKQSGTCRRMAYLTVRYDKHWILIATARKKEKESKEED